MEIKKTMYVVVFKGHFDEHEVMVSPVFFDELVAHQWLAHEQDRGFKETARVVPCTVTVQL